jgi:inosose dehydratase
MSVAVFPAGSIRFGITPTGWTNDDLPALGEEIGSEQCVSEIALAGFEGCSVGHKFPTDIDELKASLRLRGLSVSEPWHSTYFTAQAMDEQNLDGFRRQLAFIQEMGGTDIGLAELGHAVHQQPVALKANKPIFDDAQWGRMTDGLNRLGQLATDEGMRWCYHHHMGTGVQTREEVDRLMADTDAAGWSFLEGVEQGVFTVQVYGYFHELHRSERILTVVVLVIAMVQIVVTRPRRHRRAQPVSGDGID